MADIVLKNVEGTEETYEGVEQVVLQDVDGNDVIYTEGTGGVQADYGENDVSEKTYIKNRPFYEEEVNIEWDGTFDENSFTGNDPAWTSYISTFQKVSDNVYSMEDLEQFTLSYINPYSGESKSNIISNSGNMIQLELIAENLLTARNYFWSTGYILWVALKDGVYYENANGTIITFPTKGTYFAHVISNTDETEQIRPTKLTGTVLKKIDEKFLPDSIATDDDIAIAIKNKVDKVDGKGLSTNDFTNEYKNTVDTLKTDVDAGKKLSTNDFTDEYKEKIDNAQTVQSNYNQSDVRANDYIKNRPFSEDYWTIIEENAKFVTNSSNDIGLTFGFWSELTGALIKDRKYDIYLDEESYRLTCNSYVTSDNENTLVIGNAYKAFQVLDITTTSTVVDSGESFAIIQTENTESIVWAKFDETEQTTHDVKLILNDIKKIDKKFLPDDIVGEATNGLPDVTAVDNGKIMKVVNGEWQLADDEVGSETSNDSNGSYTVTHPDYNQDDSTKENHIQNRPFFEGVLSVSYDGNYADREYVDGNGIYMVRVSDYSPTAKEIIGSSYEVTTGSGVLTGTVTEDMVQSTDARMYFITVSGQPIFLVTFEDVTEDGITVTRGSYIYDFLDGTYTSKFTTANSVLKTIDEKFLPESVKTQPDWDETNESSPAYIKNKPVIGADGSVTVQSNWNQNDNTQGDYIKNRPFYDYIAEKNILEEQGLAFVYNDTYQKYTWGTVSNASLFQLVEGETYTVVWDETEYQCVAETMTLGTLTGIGLGNKNIAGIGDDTGEPFILAYISDSDVNSCMSNDTAETTHTIRIYQYVDAVKQLDDKYIPESARGIQPDWSIDDTTSKSHILNRPFYGKEVEILPLTTCDMATTNEPQCTFTMSHLLLEDNNYKVFWDDVEYICPVQKIEIDGSSPMFVLGNFYGYITLTESVGETSPIDKNTLLQNNEPFFIVIEEPESLMYGVYDIVKGKEILDAAINNNGDTSSVVCVNHTLRINHLNIKTLDSIYLPIDLQVYWNYLKNKPFYGNIEKVNLLPASSFNFEYDGEVPNSDKGMSGFSITATTEIASQYNNTKYNKAKVVIDGISYESEFQTFEGMRCLGNISLINSGVDNGEPFIIGLQNTDFMMMYLNETTDHEMGEIITHTVEFTLISENIKKIDDIYQHQPDWNESDTSKASYIKNKPFGVIGGNLLEDTTVAPIELSGTQYGGYGTYVGLVAGETYTVTFNDKDYILQAQQGESETNIVIVYESEDTSEVSFRIMENIESDGSKVQIVIWINTTTCKLQIYKGEKKIKKIPIEYLPDDVGGMPDASEEDEGKFMRVVGGQAIWATVLSAEGVRF